MEIRARHNPGYKTWQTYACVLLFIILLFLSGIVNAQEYVYVNTDNLVLRDRPEHKYHVFAVLQPNFRLKVEPYEDGYKNNKQVKSRFYQVSVSYKSNGINHYTGGWVEKKYVVTNPLKINPKYTGVVPLPTEEIAWIPYTGAEEGNPDKLNAAQYPPPKYKGGEKQEVRVYHTGARGGCYYISPKGKKVYVDKHFCK